ncbi:MAG TPA: CNP1-like family protein [Ramlibacter sp.]|jgi:hypothetical protein|nr:CNP1-like family protein [Ramlibacter sp.]
MLRNLAVSTILSIGCAGWAQQAPDFLPGTMGRAVTEESDWKEMDAPSPPALRKDGLVAIEVSGGTEMRWGIDPQSVSVGADRIVRYVVVASTRAATNASYEGINCDAGAYRVYARSSGQGWHAVETEWKTLSGGGEAQHARAIAKAGACQGHAPNGSAEQIVRDLGMPQGTKFGGSNAP